MVDLVRHCESAEMPAACVAAEIRADHSEQGWCLLCDGAILFSDGGAILPDGRVLPARAA